MSHAHALTSALRYYGKHPLQCLLMLAALSIVLALPLALHIVIDKAGLLLSGAGETLQVSIYLKPEAAPQTLQQQITATPGVRSVRLVDPAAALATFQKQSGIADALDALDANPLPAALQIQIDPARYRPAQLEALVQGWLKNPAADTAQYALDWIIRLQSILDQSRSLWRVIAAGLGLAFILILYQSSAAFTASLSQNDLPRHLRSSDGNSLASLYHGLVGGLLSALLAIAIAVPSTNTLSNTSWSALTLGEATLFLLGVGLFSGLTALLAARR